MVAPPTVPGGPGGYASREQLQRGSPYMPSVVMGQAKMPSAMMQNQQGMGGPPPPMGVARPMSQSAGGAMPPPPPPPGMPPGMPPGDRTSQLNRQNSLGRSYVEAMIVSHIVSWNKMMLKHKRLVNDNLILIFLSILLHTSFSIKYLLFGYVIGKKYFNKRV